MPKLSIEDLINPVVNPKAAPWECSRLNDFKKLPVLKDKNGNPLILDPSNDPRFAEFRKNIKEHNSKWHFNVDTKTAIGIGAAVGLATLLGSWIFSGNGEEEEEKCRREKHTAILAQNAAKEAERRAEHAIQEAERAYRAYQAADVGSPDGPTRVTRLKRRQSI